MRPTLILLAAPVLGAALAVAPHGDRDVAIIAHRGASWDAPEHTFAAWDLALEQGADWIEQDLQFTRDSVLVVFHDDSLDRTARGAGDACRGLLRERTLTELRACEVGGWFNAEYPDRARATYVGAEIPTLDSVLTRYTGRARFYIETKNPDDAPGMEEALLLLLRKHRLEGNGADSGRVIVQSFSRASLQRLRALAPTLPLVLLIEDPIAVAELEATLADIARYAVGIGPARSTVNPRLIAAAHNAGLVVHPYTVNEPATMRWMLSLGVDGMFTDRPGELARLSR